MNIIHALIYKERIPREQNSKSFEEAYTDHISAVPNCLIFQFFPAPCLEFFKILNSMSQALWVSQNSAITEEAQIYLFTNSNSSL